MKDNDLRSFSFAPYMGGAQDTDIAVAVSGGPDSMALCKALSLWAADQDRPPAIHALIVNHNIRPQAEDEAVTAYGEMAAWPHVTPTILTVGNERLNAKDSALMEEARKARYEIMAEYCRDQGIGKLFLAHHMDDQAETVLFRLAKGSGLDGLGGMRPVYPYNESLHLVRPFLNIAKAALVAFCGAEEIAVAQDPTNRDADYARPRLREAQEVLAREGLTAKRLIVTARRLARAGDALDYFAERTYREALTADEAQGLTFEYDTVAVAPEDIRIRVVQKAMADVQARAGAASAYGAGLRRIEALCDELFAADTPFRKQTLGGVIIARDDGTGRIVFEVEPAALLSAEKD